MFCGGDPPVQFGLMLPCAAHCRAVILAAGSKIGGEDRPLQFWALGTGASTI